MATHISITVEEEPIVLSGMSIYTEPDKTEYFIGDSINIEGLKLKLSYSDGSIEYITSGFSVSGFSSASVGNKNITVSYQGFTDTFGITVNTPVMVLQASDTTISLDQTIRFYYWTNPGDQNVIWSSSNINVATVTNGEVTPKSTGTTIITIKFTYNGYTYSDSCCVTVEPRYVISVSILTLPNKVTYKIGEEFNQNGLMLEITYIDNSKGTVVGTFDIRGFNPYVPGVQTLTIIYKEDIYTTFNIRVIDDSINNIGNLNGDSKITYVDYMLLKRVVMGTFVLNSENIDNADINRDGMISYVDYMLLKRVVMGTYTI